MRQSQVCEGILPSQSPFCGGRILAFTKLKFVKAECLHKLDFVKAESAFTNSSFVRAECLHRLDFVKAELPSQSQVDFVKAILPSQT